MTSGWPLWPVLSPPHGVPSGAWTCSCQLIVSCARRVVIAGVVDRCQRVGRVERRAEVTAARVERRRLPEVDRLRDQRGGRATEDLGPVPVAPDSTRWMSTVHGPLYCSRSTFCVIASRDGIEAELGEREAAVAASAEHAGCRSGRTARRWPSRSTGRTARRRGCSSASTAPPPVGHDADAVIDGPVRAGRHRHRSLGRDARTSAAARRRSRWRCTARPRGCR